MTAPVLQNTLGDGGAGFDQSMGNPSTLYEVLKAIVPWTGKRVETLVASPTVATIVTYKAITEGVIQSFRASVGTCGSAGTTTAQLKKGSTVIASLSFLHSETDGTAKETKLTTPVQVAVGDVITVALSAVATDAANVAVDSVVQAVGLV
jgi:hypothetical protein